MTDIDTVRDKIGDVDSTEYILTDAEIQIEIDKGDDLLLASSRCARKIAARYSRRVTQQIEGLTINYSDLAKQFLLLAQELKNEYMEATTVTTVTMPVIGKIKSSDVANYPSRQKMTDVERQEWGDE